MSEQLLTLPLWLVLISLSTSAFTECSETKIDPLKALTLRLRSRDLLGRNSYPDKADNHVFENRRGFAVVSRETSGTRIPSELRNSTNICCRERKLYREGIYLLQLREE
jgi:hypothetical protein